MKKTAGILLYKKSDKKLLTLIVFNGKHWSIPKGVIIKGESALRAAARELREETKLRAPSKLKFLAKVKDGGRRDLRCYQAEWKEGKPRPSREIKRCRFVPISRAVKLVQAYQRPLLQALAKRAS